MLDYYFIFIHFEYFENRSEKNNIAFISVVMTIIIICEKFRYNKLDILKRIPYRTSKNYIFNSVDRLCPAYHKA